MEDAQMAVCFCMCACIDWMCRVIYAYISSETFLERSRVAVLEDMSMPSANARRESLLLEMRMIHIILKTTRHELRAPRSMLDAPVQILRAIVKGDIYIYIYICTVYSVLCALGFGNTRSQIYTSYILYISFQMWYQLRRRKCRL